MDQVFCNHVFVAGKRRGQECKRFIRCPNELKCYDHKTTRIENKKKHIKDTNYGKEYYLKNKTRLNEKGRLYSAEHKAEKAAYDKLYSSTHKETRKEYIRNWHRDKYNNDDKYRITNLLRNRIYKSLKKGYYSKETEELVGTDFNEFREYIECLWEPGMSWDNYGSLPDGTSPTHLVWEIDHILPCVSFDLLDPEQQKICFNYTNLQPLYAADNLFKKDKII